MIYQLDNLGQNFNLCWFTNVQNGVNTVGPLKGLNEKIHVKQFDTWHTLNTNTFQNI